MFLAKLLEFLKNHWTKIVPAALALAAGFGVAWWMKPSQVEIHETTKTVEVEKKDTRIDEVLKQLETMTRNYDELKNSQLHEKYHKEITETVAADGSKTKKTTIDKNVDSVVQETKHEVEVKIVEVEKQVIVKEEVVVTKTETIEKIIKPVLAQWRVGPMIGVNPRLFPNPTVGTVVYGVEVERRILGPFWLGAWGMGNTAVGGFVGVKVGAEF